MKKLIFFIYFLILYENILGLSFSIAPTKFQVDLQKTSNHEVYLINNTASPLRIKIYTEAPKSYEKYNLNENIVIFPKIISIKPGSKQEVRFRVKPSENIKEKGEYRSFLVFEEVLPEIKTKNIEENETKVGTELKIITETVINVFGETEDTEIRGQMKNFKYKYKDSKLYMTADVVSEGNTSLKINYLIKNGNKKIYEGKFGNSLRTGENKIIKEIPFEISNELKSNSEKLKIIFTEQNKKILYESDLSKI